MPRDGATIFTDLIGKLDVLRVDALPLFFSRLCLF
jgi:hypothetical protein